LDWDTIDEDTGVAAVLEAEAEEAAEAEMVLDRAGLREVSRHRMHPSHGHG